MRTNPTTVQATGRRLMLPIALPNDTPDNANHNPAGIASAPSYRTTMAARNARSSETKPTQARATATNIALKLN